MDPPPSRRTSPSLERKDATPSLPAESSRRGSLQDPEDMSKRFMPHASETSIGATLPRKIEARKEETNVIRDVALYTSGLSR